jgi:hypothetical protein
MVTVGLRRGWRLTSDDRGGGSGDMREEGEIGGS